jgi:hypothetical protein
MCTYLKSAQNSSVLDPQIRESVSSKYSQKSFSNSKCDNTFQKCCQNHCTHFCIWVGGTHKINISVSRSAKIDVWRILVSSIPLVYDGNRFLRFLY